jgi:hypothetical protein
MEDAARKGRMCQGMRHHRAAVSPETVAAVRREYRPGNGPELMQKYGIKRSNFYYLLRRVTWKSVP